MDTKLTGKTRIESDLIGAREIPAEALYGVQTLRGIENFSISKFRLSEYPLFIKGLAITKMAAAMANFELGLLTIEQRSLVGVINVTPVLTGDTRRGRSVYFLLILIIHIIDISTAL